jgi:hypothetical protein
MTPLERVELTLYLMHFKMFDKAQEVMPDALIHKNRTITQFLTDAIQSGSVTPAEAQELENRWSQQTNERDVQRLVALYLRFKGDA